jgi:twinkle protein
MYNVDYIESKTRALDDLVLSSEEIDADIYAEIDGATHQVHRAVDWLDELQAELNAPVRDTSLTLPWATSHGKFGFRTGEVTLYAGGNGGGKSLVTGQIAMNLMRQGQKVCIASFEMKPKRTLYRMIRQFSGENIEAPRISRDLSHLFSRFFNFCGESLWLYDQQGTTSSRQVVAMARYCAVKLGIQHIFIDSLMKCVSGEDDYNAQKGFVDQLTAVARDHGVHIHLIHHIRKLQSEEVQPNKNDIKGSGAIADQVDNVLLVWRNKKKEHQARQGSAVDISAPDAMLMCEKQRNGESEDWFSLWYHADSQQFVESYDAVPMDFDNKGRF